MPSRAKRIAELVEKYIDPTTTKIEDWQWRPLSDVYRDTGYIEEVPAYIQDNFGQFMLDQTDRARRGEMGPRDMLKGYGIVSSSIMRGARDPESLVKSGLKIYDADPGEIRPEGAFANWLMSPLGQRYLDLGSTGVADLEAIEDIRRGFRPFGRQNELADSLKYAAEELAPRGAELNELVLGSADDWRRFTEGVDGVSAGKSGFLASMFGRGDIPTFDTRQVVLHTGLPSKLISKYMSRSIGGRPIGGYEAVDRQAARQAALELGLDPALLDKYQHLAHHAIWDRIGNERTTHKDLIRTLRPGMAKGGLVALMERALKLAQERAALPVEQHGLGLHPRNTPAERAEAMGAVDYLHGTDRLDRFLSGRLPDPKRATSGPMPFGTDAPELASKYAESKADTSLRLNDEGNMADYFQVMPQSMGLRGKTPINVEQAWHLLAPEKKAEILDKAPRIGYANPAEAEGAWTLHPTAEGAPSSKDHWDYMLKREAKGNPLSALRAIFAESGTLDPYAPTELSDIYKLAGFPYEITQTNAPWASAKGVFTGKAMISNPLDTSDSEVLQDTVVPFLKEQFKNDRTRLKLGVDPWDKRARFTPRDWVNQLEADLSEGKNSFVWTSIPDKVTAQLEKLGYNGILDTGGKMGGPEHQVVIPFRPDQVRSKFAAFDPWRKDAATAAALGLAAPDLLAAEPEEYARGGLVGGLGDLVKKYLTAYHGTPHTFRPTAENPLGAFDLSKIGTGEGAQAYGHGIYLAENPLVAAQYRKDLSNFEHPFIRFGNQKIAGSDLSDLDLEAFKALEYGKRDAGQFPHNTLYYAKKRAESNPELLRRLESFGRDVDFGHEINKGSLYTVELPEDKVIQMLDWDKSLSDQSKEVQAALSSAKNKQLQKMIDYANVPYSEDIDGETKTMGEAFRLLNLNLQSKPSANSPKASQMLLRQGIPGIKYLDNSSRAAGEGTRNFVIFDPSITNIVDRKAKGGLVGLADKYLPRMMSIFSGGGTLEHGLEGMVRPVMAVEKDLDIARHYARAHGDHVVTSDVRDINFAPMAGEVDYLHASPSCTNYSSAGCRIESPIDLMTADATARAIRDIRPPLFTLENVPAYQDRQAFRKISDELNEQGYNWDIVRHNAADLGAPSTRNRMMVRAALGDLPPAQQYWPKPGDWFPAIEDQLESMRPSKLAPWQLKRLAERGIDPTSLDTPLLVGGGSGFKGDIPLAFAGKPGITVLSSPVQTDRVVLPGGDVRALNPRSYARLLGLSDSYPLPDDRNLAKIIVGNGMAPAMTREVVGPLISEGLRSILKKYE